MRTRPVFAQTVTFGKNSTDKVATKQLTAVVDVMLMPCDNPNTLDGHEIH